MISSNRFPLLLPKKRMLLSSSKHFPLRQRENITNHYHSFTLLFH
ncbi:Protein CBG25493 [Caenorhabditis briggsae]|uniref:Protein CBG25493 n=1 Tax=Caenorhabditis briggsae TaxID=6238 RepID=B6IEN3_CAEBR|nr:Protein CBG25493 [Caenorhabditis briggsae]CAR98363.1 Protein CBG25493 [Caenorhabditis briggsae]